MKLFVSFDPHEDVIYVWTKIFGPSGSRTLKLALDTGATLTMIHSKDLTAVGYKLETIAKSASIVTGSRPESVKALVINRIEAIDQSHENFNVICHDLPEESGVDGLLGLNFLRHFDTEIKYSDNTLSLQPIIPF